MKLKAILLSVVAVSVGILGVSYYTSGAKAERAVNELITQLAKEHPKLTISIKEKTAVCRQFKCFIERLMYHSYRANLRNCYM